MTDQPNYTVVIDFSTLDDLDIEVPWVPADPPIRYDDLEMYDGELVDWSEVDEEGLLVRNARDEYWGVVARSQRLAIHATNALNTKEWWGTYQDIRQTPGWHKSDDPDRDYELDLVRALWTALRSITYWCLHDYLRGQWEYQIYVDPWWEDEVFEALDTGAMYSVAYAQSMRDRLDVLSVEWWFRGTVEVNTCMALFALIIEADTRLAPKLDIG